MYPTLDEGDRVLVNRLAYLFSSPKKRDIVVANDPRYKKIIIKRITKIENNHYFIEGDNKSASTDSRKFGSIDKKNIVGKVVFAYIIIFTLCSIFSSNIVFAETNVNISNNGVNSNTSVNVKTNTGQNTICQNGKCITTGSTGKSTVCINGKCQTSQDGNLDIRSENGNVKVNIKNSSSTTASAEINKMVEKRNEARKLFKNKKKLIKKKIADNRTEFQKILDDIKSLFTPLHFF